MAIVALMSNFAKITSWWREIDWKAVGAYALGGVPAAALGARTLLILPENTVEVALGLFFLAVGDTLPLGFVQALIAIGYRTVPLRGEGKVVDIAIQRTAEALAGREADVLLVSHDKDFVPQMQALAADPERRTGIVGFQEFMAADLRNIPGIEFFDLEHDVHAFTSTLPRVRIIEIDEFDPLEFIL